MSELVANKELHDVFTPLCIEAAHIIKPDTIELKSPNAISAIHKLQPIKLDGSLINLEAQARLPWDVFLNHDIYPAHRDRSEGVDKLNEILDDWEARNPAMLNPDKENDLKWIEYYFEEFYLRGAYPINVEVWRQYEQFMLGLNDETRTEVDEMNLTRLMNIRKADIHDPETEMTQAAELLYLRNPFVPDHEEAFGEKHIILPVGAYGAEFTDSLIRSVVLAQSQTRAKMLVSASKATEGHEETLRRYTARGNEQISEVDAVSGNTTLDTLQEGILTIAQTVAILTNQKVTGYDDPYALAQDIANNGLVERFAAYTALGIVGPMAISGTIVANPLEKTESGLSFSSALETYLKTKRQKYLAALAVEKTSGQVMPTSIGRPCPVSDKGGGISVLAPALIDLATALQPIR